MATVIEILEARRAELTGDIQDVNRAIEAIRGARKWAGVRVLGPSAPKPAKADVKAATPSVEKTGKRVVSEETKAKMRAAHAARKARKEGDTDVAPALEVHYENGEAIGAEE